MNRTSARADTGARMLRQHAAVDEDRIAELRDRGPLGELSCVRPTGEERRRAPALLSIDRVKNPNATDRHVALRGFSWIVEPSNGGVVIAIEIPTGAAVAGPFPIPQENLDRLINSVLDSGRPKPVIH